MPDGHYYLLIGCKYEIYEKYTDAFKNSIND